jgi:hypothetical protein
MEEFPMLRFGLQALEGKKLILPTREIFFPDKDRLAKRYENFLNK